MRKAMIFTAAFAMTAVSATTVSAKSSLHLRTNKASTSSKYISGKATPHTKITMTRYGMVYAKGTSSKHGTFKIRLRSVLSSGWKYRMTASKKGYSVKKMYVSIPKKSVSTGVKATPYPAENNPNTNGNTLSSSATSPQTPVSQPTNTTPTPTVPTNGTSNQSDDNTINPENGLTKAQEAQLQSQIDDLGLQVSAVQDQKYTLNGQSENDMAIAHQDQEDIGLIGYDKKTLQNRIDYLTQAIIKDKANNDLLAAKNDQNSLNECNNNMARKNQLESSGITIDKLKADILAKQNDSVIQSDKAESLQGKIDALQAQRQVLIDKVDPIHHGM